MKPFWVVLLTFIITGSLVGGGTYYYLSNQAEKEKVDLTKKISDMEADQTALQLQLEDFQREQAITEPASVDKTADWETYTDSANKFSFKYPKDFNLMNERGTYSETKPNVRLDSGDVNDVSDADGACGSASSDLYKAQSTAFSVAKEGESFDKAYATTNLKTVLSTIITNKAGIKFAQGFQLCQGIVEPNDNVGFKLRALTFRGNYRYQIAVDVPSSISAVLAKDQETTAMLINDGKSTGPAQKAFDDFKLVVDSFKF